MSDKTNLFLFSKKEIALIFVFILALFVISFVFGVKIGKDYSEQLCDISSSDKELVELLSEDDEIVADLELEEQSSDDVDKLNDEKKLLADSYGKLQAEFDKLGVEDTAIPTKTIAGSQEVKDPMTTPEEVKYKDDLSGKFTVQLGSLPTRAEAEKFADAFKVRGYDVIINLVELKDKGSWYRVSLGVFDSLNDAKAYIEKEKSLFTNTDFIIGKFD